MAKNKVTRSHSSAQPKPQHAKTARAGDPGPQRRRRNSQPNDHQRKAELFETLHHLNRGYGIALSALERLETKDRQLRPAIFPGGCLRDYRNRTEALRAVANRDLLRLLAGHEDHDAARFTNHKPSARRT